MFLKEVGHLDCDAVDANRQTQTVSQVSPEDKINFEREFQKRILVHLVSTAKRTSQKLLPLEVVLFGT